MASGVVDQINTTAQYARINGMINTLSEKWDGAARFYFSEGEIKRLHSRSLFKKIRFLRKNTTSPVGNGHQASFGSNGHGHQSSVVCKSVDIQNESSRDNLLIQCK